MKITLFIVLIITAFLSAIQAVSGMSYKVTTKGAPCEDQFDDKEEDKAIKTVAVSNTVATVSVFVASVAALVILVIF